MALDCAWLNEPGISFAERRQDDFGIDVVRMLAIVGCSVAEIVAITGHSLTDVLDRHYLNRDPQLAENAIRKLETRTKTQETELPNVRMCSRFEKGKAQYFQVAGGLGFEPRLAESESQTPD